MFLLSFEIIIIFFLSRGDSLKYNICYISSHNKVEDQRWYKVYLYYGVFFETYICRAVGIFFGKSNVRMQVFHDKTSYPTITQIPRFILQPNKGNWSNYPYTLFRPVLNYLSVTPSQFTLLQTDTLREFPLLLLSCEIIITLFS